MSDMRLGRIREVLSQYVDRGESPGCVALCSRRGETYVEAIGHADISAGTPMARDSIFRMASLTKAVTAVAAMILVEEARLRLDESLEKWLPELADCKVLRSLDGPVDDTVPADRQITVRDLLTFRCGRGALMAPPNTYPIQALVREVGIMPGPVAPAFTNDEWMERLGRLPLTCQPGERWMYHTGSDIAGVLISRVAGMSLGAFMNERIFRPLGMSDTGFSVPTHKTHRLTNSYTRGADGKLCVSDLGVGGMFSEPPLFEAGGGGLVSTADDFLAFGQMLLNGGIHGSERVLSRPSVELMTTDQLTLTQKEHSPFYPGFWDTEGWGFGFSVTTRRDWIGPNVGSYGWTGGTGTYWRNDPREQLVTIFLNQRLMTAPNDVQIYSDYSTLAYQAIDD
jgi:CubicO group peptidase (beta-lactamase class C family)